MTSRFTELCIDCHDPHRLAEFWCAVLGYRVTDTDDETVEIRPDEMTADAVLAAPITPSLLFIRVPEAKTVKNRLHIDVSPVDSDQATEVARLLALGATHTDVGQGDDKSWVVLADPEGNEFCVLRSLAPA